MMNIVTLVLGPLQVNCYLFYDETTKECMVIDPGAEGPKIIDEIEKRDLRVKYILNTHGHVDHISANAYVKERLEAPLLIHEEDAAMLGDGAINMSSYLGEEINKPLADRLLKDGDVLELGENKIRVLHTPGHTRGGISLICGNICFSGDTLFLMSVGRTDLPGGSFKQLIDSIKNKLFTLDDEVVVYPGHGPETTIGQEKAGNPFVTC